MAVVGAADRNVTGTSPTTFTVTLALAVPSVPVTVTVPGPSTVHIDPLQLPDGLSVPSAGVVPSQGSCRLLGRTVSCQLGTITGGGQVTITIPVAVDAGSFEGQPAVVVVLVGSSTRYDVFVVTPACSSADATLLYYASVRH